MSEESVEIVRSLLAAHEGEDVLPAVRDSLQRLGPDPQPDAAAAVLADDPGWKYYHRDIEWDTSGVSGVATKANGLRELAVWWSLWVAAFSRHEYKNVTYQELGDWVMTVADVDAQSCEVDVRRPAVQLWRVSNGKVTVMRAFESEDDARAAAAA
jgi:hypothetical protein